MSSQIKCELHNDNFQNYKRYNIPKAQLVIADIPYNIGANAYGSSPEWYIGGDRRNGESSKAGKAFFHTDINFNIAEYFHFCNRLLKKEPKERGKAPAMLVFCSFQQLQTVIRYGERYGFRHNIPLVFVKNYSAQVLKANMRVVGATEYGLLLYRDKLPKFNNGVASRRPGNFAGTRRKKCCRTCGRLARKSRSSNACSDGGCGRMKIGLIDVDGHHWPNLALMKLSAWHKAQGDTVEWWSGFSEYDRVYMSKVFDETYTPDILEPVNTKEIVRGGTGYGLDNRLPVEVEHIYPDYTLYPALTKDTAYGFLTRGCPRGCHFCIVSQKEGRASRKVADLSEWWRGQKNIKLLDPNLLACREHMDLLGQLADSGAWVDFTQGLDARLLTVENIQAIGTLKLKEIHFAWDYMAESGVVMRGLRRYAAYRKKNRHGKYATVYVLTNYNTTMRENLYRIYTLRDMGFDPYVMIYDKPSAPREIRLLQRWCNNRLIFRAEPDFYKYDPKRG